MATLSRLLRLREVCALTGYSRDTIYRLGRVGKFPRRVKLSDHASRWREDEILAWIEQRTAERDAQAARCAGAKGGGKMADTDALSLAKT